MAGPSRSRRGVPLSRNFSALLGDPHKPDCASATLPALFAICVFRVAFLGVPGWFTSTTANTKESTIMTLVKISQRDVRPGTPLEFAIYSAAGKLLLGKGYVVQSESQIERLFDMGAFRDDAPPDAESQSVHGKRAPGDVIREKLLTSTASFSGSRENVSTTLLPAMSASPEAFVVNVRGRESRPVRARYFGMMQDQFLLVGVPDLCDQQESLVAGVELDAKILIGTSVFRFPTTIAARHATPFDVLYLAWPEKVDRQTLRRHVRVETRLPARLLRNDAVTSGFEATVLNMSANGVGLSLNGATLQLGEHFRLSVRLSAGGRFHAVMLTCIVRNQRITEAGMTVGAEFGTQAEETRRIVKDFMFDAATGARL